MYQPGDALDPDRFLKAVLPGATPQIDSPDVYNAHSVHERFLATPDLRLLPDAAIVRQTVLKAVKEGKVVVRTSDGKKQRAPGTLNTLTLDDTVLIARADSPAAQRWLAVESAPPGPGVGPTLPPRPPRPGRVIGTTWEKLVEYATDRPLMELELRASTPAAAATLMSLAQPIGADTLSLSVSVSGVLKDGGATYEAELKLGFSPAKSGLADPLAALREAAPEDISPRAEFDKP